MSGILGIPIKYRIKNALKLIPEEYGIPADSKVLDLLRLKEGDDISCFSKYKGKMPCLESVNYKEGEVDPIWLMYDILWFKYDINKFGHFTKENKKSKLIIIQENSPNKLLIRTYGSKNKFKAPIGCIEKKDWNYTKSILNENMEERDVAICTAVRETKEETGIDITVIPNYLNRITLMSLEQKSNVFIYEFILILTSDEYEKYIIQILENPDENFYNSIDPEISEIKYK
jgi:hypothetical protein